MEASLKNEEYKRMSFVFPIEFYELLLKLKEKYNMDMTYIIIQAVNYWVVKKERLEGMVGHG